MTTFNFADKYNAIVGGIITLLSAVFGIFWYVFAALLVLNVIDWLTGWYKSRKKGKESSSVGLHGILKKLGLWAIIVVAFVISEVLVNLGRDVLHMDLNFLQLLGWFTVTMIIVNEARSILENLVECGYNVPQILIKGLAITQKMLEAANDIGEDKDDGTD